MAKSFVLVRNFVRTLFIFLECSLLGRLGHHIAPMTKGIMSQIPIAKELDADIKLLWAWAGESCGGSACKVFFNFMPRNLFADLE